MGRPYSVQRGDSLTAIARRFGLKSWQDLYNSPDNTAFRAKRPNPNLIFPGDVIVIPEQRPDKPATTISPPPISPTGKDTGPFNRNNTDLGKFSHGNFDVAYDPGKATLQVTLKVTYRFEKEINPNAQNQFKVRLNKAVQAWDNAGAYLRSKGPVLNPI